MAQIRPFKAIRPTRDKANLLASRSYLSYSDEILKEKLEHNPYTFLHIINPDYNDKIKQTGIPKFEMVKEKFQAFQEDGILIQDKEETFYIYEQRNGSKIYSGIIAATAVADYLDDKIKKHEHTLTHKEEMFRNYLNTTGFNAEPVLLCYKENDSINTIIKYYQALRSEYEFATTNKAVHKLWLVNNKQHINQIITAFETIDKLYIADGHHRCASSALLSKDKDTDLSNYFMSFLIAENQLNIINFNRLIKQLNGLSAEEFIKKIELSFTTKIIDTNVYSPTSKDEISMYLEGKWYSLIIKDSLVNQDPVSKLDPAILSNNILAPILNIIDEKTDKNIVFEAGTTPLTSIKNKIDNSEFSVAFILKPIPIESLKEVADNNAFMPPKSTYIEPKLRSGLTIYPLE